jgi:hypothetical protein
VGGKLYGCCLRVHSWGTVAPVQYVRVGTLGGAGKARRIAADLTEKEPVMEGAERINCVTGSVQHLFEEGPSGSSLVDTHCSCSANSRRVIRYS